ncbi:lipase family protein [Alteromonas lipolytica]|uniref:Fungal lipase-type domain-containing protein n=1 Tax=Alteromonas lipolytica TaxID=1856405 RepID=A0A1E8FFT8_9ALTE|nr:lipase family protein [Alteromonas lipolytica]OFI34812.1 hypothetical protein BFC17_14655 [Alteromonas lipolytica]GGF54196.1 hypothetical protein GCM10011338_02980 [Alteromonas lipolytica]
MTTYAHLYPSLEGTENYSKKNALALALLAKLAYEKSTVGRKVARQQWGFKHYQYFTVKKGSDVDTQAILCANDTDVVIAFRGTAEMKNDWLTNLQAVREAGPLRKTLAHEGFQDALFPAVIRIVNAIDSRLTNSKRLWITGHSLGGALASLFAAMLIENKYNVYGLYTYASPRPGDATFADNLNAAIKGPHFRIVNESDVVPHVPPEPFFSHPGSRKILKEQRVVDDNRSWFKERIKALKDFVERVGDTFDVIDNHSLWGGGKSYIERLLKDYERD